MQDSKIIRLLRTLNAKEFRLLHKYFRSPFFNYSTAILDLYELLREYYPAFDHPALERRLVFQKLFPDTVFKDKKFRNLLHEFLGHLENFLVQLHIRTDDHARKKLLAATLKERDQYPAFVEKNRELLSEVADRPYRDTQTYKELLQLQEDYYFHPATRKLDGGEVVLKAMLDNLDHFFMASKLRLANEVAVREKLVREKIPVHLVGEVFRELESRESAEILLQFYGLMFRLTETEREELYRQLQEMFLGKADKLSFGDQQMVLSQLLNFAIRNGNRGKSRFLVEAFDLYWLGLEKGLLFQHGKLTDSTYTNIVFLGGKTGALDKVETFIREHSRYLDNRIRNDAQILAMANLLYFKKAYAELDELIGNAKFDSIFYQLRARMILLRALFESFLADETYYELLHSRMESLEKLLKRNALLSDVQKAPYLNFIKFLKRIVRMKQKAAGPAELEKLRQKIRGNDSVAHKNWLLEQK